MWKEQTGEPMRERLDPPPTKTLTAYKQVRVDNQGNLHPLYVDSNFV